MAHANRVPRRTRRNLPMPEWATRSAAARGLTPETWRKLTPNTGAITSGGRQYILCRHDKPTPRPASTYSPDMQAKIAALPIVEDDGMEPW